VWVAALLPAQKPYRTSPTGYADTPVLPGQKWRVHDIARPKPPVVTPAAQIGQPPSDALVLFDGKDLSHWTKPAWKVENGCMEVKPAQARWSRKKRSWAMRNIRLTARRAPSMASGHRW